LLSCDEGGLARRINEKPARYPRPRSILFRNHDFAAAGAVLREALGAHALANTHSCAPGIVEQQEIQRIALDMQTWPVISEVAEGNLGDLIAPDHDPAGLLDIAVAFNRFTDAQEVEIFPCRRQDAFTDGLARVMRFVDEQNVIAAFGEPKCGRAAGRTTSDDQNIRLSCHAAFSLSLIASAAIAAGVRKFSGTNSSTGIMMLNRSSRNPTRLRMARESRIPWSISSVSAWITSVPLRVGSPAIQSMIMSCVFFIDPVNLQSRRAPSRAVQHGRICRSQSAAIPAA